MTRGSADDEAVGLYREEVRALAHHAETADWDAAAGGAWTAARGGAVAAGQAGLVRMVATTRSPASCSWCSQAMWSSGCRG